MLTLAHLLASVYFFATVHSRISPRSHLCYPLARFALLTQAAAHAFAARRSPPSRHDPAPTYSPYTLQSTFSTHVLASVFIRLHTMCTALESKYQGGISYVVVRAPVAVPVARVGPGIPQALKKNLDTPRYHYFGSVFHHGAPRARVGHAYWYAYPGLGRLISNAEGLFQMAFAVRCTSCKVLASNVVISV